jgi:hypothetical protein
VTFGRTRTNCVPQVRKAEGEGEMNELEPKAVRSQWLWFGAALLAMTIIALSRVCRDKVLACPLWLRWDGFPGGGSVQFVVWESWRSASRWKDLVLMARNRKLGGWSYKEDRRLLELAKHSRSAEEIANLMNRSPDTVRKMAIRLGVSLNKNRR